MRTSNLEVAKSMISSGFGSAHILSHREIFTNSVASGKASTGEWKDSTLDLMNECMAYGHNVWGSNPMRETGIDKTQLPLFAMAPNYITGDGAWWLRDVASSSEFAAVDFSSSAHRYEASYPLGLGVRPAFAIIG